MERNCIIIRWTTSLSPLLELRGLLNIAASGCKEQARNRYVRAYASRARKRTLRLDMHQASLLLPLHGCSLKHSHSLPLLTIQTSATLGIFKGKGGRGA